MKSYMSKDILGCIFELVIREEVRYIGMTYTKGIWGMESHIAIDLWKYSMYINFGVTE